MYGKELNWSNNSTAPDAEADDDNERLCKLLATRAEILSLQLDHVLGRQPPSGPCLHEECRATNRGLNVRLRYLREAMEAREEEIPILNRRPSADTDHCNLICPSFLRESVNYDQPTNIDLSNSDYDLNSNIQMTYPETSATSFTENTSGDYFTGNNDTGNGSGCNNSLCRQNGECLTHSHPENEEDATTGNGNETGNNSGTGNETGNEPGNYREMGEGLISQLLAQENIDSFAVIYNDGNAHFQGSAPDSTFNLSAIEPYEGANPNNESYDDYADANTEFNLEMPIRFEKGHQL